MTFEITGHKPGLEGSFIRTQTDTATVALLMARQWAEQGVAAITITNPAGESYDIDRFGMIVSTMQEGNAMKELYASPNGDRWYLAYSPESQQAFVRHIPNQASGGAPSNIELADFLSRDGNPPEKQALMRLIGAQAGQEAEPLGRLPAGAQGPHSPTD